MLQLLGPLGATLLSEKLSIQGHDSGNEIALMARLKLELGVVHLHEGDGVHVEFPA